MSRTCQICGHKTKLYVRQYAKGMSQNSVFVCKHCHKMMHVNTNSNPINNSVRVRGKMYNYYKHYLNRDIDYPSRVIEKYKPKIIGDSMKDFKMGQIVRYVKVANFRKFPSDNNILVNFLNKTGEIIRIGKTENVVFTHKLIEVRFIMPNMKKKDVLCVRRELTDASDEEKKRYAKVKEQFEAVDIARKI